MTRLLRNSGDILSFMFWGNFAAYCVHVLDETLMGGGFVAGIRAHFWPSYPAYNFFVVNAVGLAVIAFSNVLYDWQGDRFIVLPITWVWERSFNGLWHIGWTVHFKEYSPGLVSSSLFFVILYLLFGYGVLKGHVKQTVFFGGGVIGLLLETLLLSSLWWAQKIH